MDALELLLLPYGEYLTVADVAALLGWSESDARDLVESHPELQRADGGTSADALHAFLVRHRQGAPVEPFVPVRQPGLPPLEGVVRANLNSRFGVSYPFMEFSA